MQLEKRISFLFLIALLSFVSVSATAQTVKELEQQRKQMLKTLETTKKLLNETKRSQRSSLNKLTIINKNISERKVLITSMNSEIGKLDDQISLLNSEKEQLEQQLRRLKSDYARLVQEAHINRSLYAKIMFILSSSSFDQSFRRLRYLQEFSDYRKQQVRQIESVKRKIELKNDSLTQHKFTKIEVVKQKETETLNLSADQKKERVLLTDLQKKAKKLDADARIQQKKASDLNNKIAAIIAAEIRKADAKRAQERQKRLAQQKAEESKRLAEAKRLAEQKKDEERKKRLAAEEAAKKRKDLEEKTAKAKNEANQEALKAARKVEEEARAEAKQAETEAKKAEQEAKPVDNTALTALTKEESLLDGSFSSNRGRLPWPTASGFISGHFGIQPHPVLKHVTMNNKGVYIQTPSGSSARAVFDGVVTQRFSIPGSNNGVIIQHGNYRTVYANLTDIFVNIGQKVSTKQAIGRIYTDGGNDNKSELYFQIWNGKTILNPEGWIAK